ncbi:hypothetical protein [Nocardiopsis sp. L17-MgMaSL7]|uniref:hypothetical protein n=1 Tax=Nocardiopsis sp. L17-MgMaSL7 TaxID=1938893 RepID=UPI000D71C0FF|nr:hypothetical protein [Nocardiopsis sp. L17-MgMaSL7]
MTAHGTREPAPSQRLPNRTAIRGNEAVTSPPPMKGERRAKAWSSATPATAWRGGRAGLRRLRDGLSPAGTT